MLRLFSSKPQSDARTETHDMILLTIARAEENAQALNLVALARELDLSPILLTYYLQPLLDQSLVHSASGAITLTEAGRKRALGLLRRHRLTERLLTDVLGLDWTSAHEEADRLEHVVSPEAEGQLASQLGDPETCPHGNPIPTGVGERQQIPLSPLSDCAAATRATIARIALETPAALRHLATLGLLPNVEIEVENKAPFDGPVLVRLGSAHYALGHDLAARIWVKPA
jgi:DtxR family Mn-dependent transcriptional regulator